MKSRNRFIRILSLSPLFGLIIYFLIPGLSLYPLFDKTNVYIISLCLSFILGYNLLNSRSSFSFKYELSTFGPKLYIILVISVLFSLLVWVVIMGGISTVLSGALRNIYYNNQYDSSQLRFIVSKYIGLVFLGFPLIAGLLTRRLNRTVRIINLLLIVLITLTKVLIGSRLFIIYVLSYFCGIAYVKYLSKKRIVSLLIVFLLAIIYGFYTRYRTIDINNVLDVFNATTNLTYIVSNNYTDFDFKSVLFNLSLLPIDVIGYEVPNMTLLKYGSLKGSSEPMPVIVSLYYSVGWYSSLYFLFFGLVSQYAYKKALKGDILHFLLLLTLSYIFMVYINHSSLRASGRYFMLVLHVILMRRVFKQIATHR